MKNLTGVYTAPAHLVEVEEETENRHVATKNDYNNQRYNRALDMEVHTYKERMEFRKQTEEPPAKKLRHDEDAAIARESINGEESSNGNLLKTTEDTYAKPDSKQSKEANGHTDPETTPADKEVATISDLPQVDGTVLTDELLSRILPPGYIVAYQAEPGSAPTPAPVLYMPLEATIVSLEPEEYDGIALKPTDLKYFGDLVLANDKRYKGEKPSKRRLRALDLVLRAKNSVTLARRKALRLLASSALEIGAAPIFNIILPLLVEPALDDADRHVLTRLATRVIIQLDTEIRPHTHQIVTAIAPLLIDEDMTLRLEARDAIAAVSNAAGLANVVASLRPDLDHADEYVRNLTARVFAVVATTLGLAKFLPFLRAVIRLKRSWQAPHTGIRIIHHLCILLGGGNGAPVLPYLAPLVEVLQPGLTDELMQVRTATANTLAQLAEAVQPYGIEAFEPVLEAVSAGLRQHRGRSLAAYLRCVGALVPLMAHNPAYEEYAHYYSRELMLVMSREFASPDDEVRRAVLRILAALPISKAVFPDYRRLILKPFLQHFWTRRVALDPVARLVVDATAHLASRLDAASLLEQLSPYAKDANESLRRMAADAIHKIATLCPDAFVEIENDASLVDAVLYAFQEQTQPHVVYLLAVSSVCKAFGPRLKPHEAGIVSTVLYRLKNSDPAVRQQAADLGAATASLLDSVVVHRLILFLYELLGEVYPEVLGSVVGALYACVATLDRAALAALDNPSVSMLVPTLTPILKNRHEKVQEQSLKLVGLVAQRCATAINAKEWMRVCFDLLDMLKSQRKRIRIAANATFGHVARCIGPQDVLAMLLNNLRVQERQLRVCTAVAIGIVADTCAPFTVLPALMNEYRVPDKNVQNGVLKSLSFVFEYIPGSMARDYLYAITPILEDALTDRDQVHRQTAATAVAHVALNCAGGAHDYHDVFVHFLNLVIPNLFELSPHVISRVVECVGALRIAIGPGVFFNYIWPGLFHAARKVRAPYWKVYNSAYVQNCDAIVPCYPRLDLEDGRYNVDELDVWL